MLGLMAFGTTYAQDAISLPDNAKAGECYARVATPPQFKTESERVLKRDASFRIEVTPATFNTVTERVLVKEGGEKIILVDESGNPLKGNVKPVVRTLSDGTVEVSPTGYKTVTERVLVQDSYETIEEVSPAIYETVTERMMVSPARTEWKPSNGRIYGNAVADGSGELITKSDSKTGEVMCLVEIPAEYKTVTKRVLKEPAKTRTVTVPAEYKTVTKQIPTKVYTKTVSTPPAYDTVSRKVVDREASERRIEIPAEYETVTRRVKVADGEVKWMPVLCEQNVTRSTVMDLQRALKAKGYNPGTVDGALGQGTMDAVLKYQRAEGLATGELTLQTLNKLGVSL
ncbi:MAG: peptidoglycan-binding protein [Rhodothermia bacterium]|nr:peptidoglycan-binding protein [Rhodothermia bacterium]